jgi:serine/threonine-protein kinase
MKRENPQFSILNSKLGGYDVRELLGRGGMASVYKGYDAALDREVAIKVISTADQPADFVARFQREARVAASLRHPHIVQIYHFGGQQDIVYMVQELLPGPTLERRIREAGRRRMAAERVHTTIAQLADALDFAHAQGVVHRDVKPSNALYNAHGHLVLTDFGIARSRADTTQITTGPGVVMGTPGYVAPEQAISSAVLAPACDIYALGVVLFELLTGRLPFEADTPMGMVLKHLYDDPPRPSSLRPDLPGALDAVVLRALHKEPDERYPSAGALAQALQTAWPAPRAAVSAGAPAGPARARATPKAATPTPARAKPESTPTPKARAASSPASPAIKRDTPPARTPPKGTPARTAPKAAVSRKAVAARVSPAAQSAPPRQRPSWRLRVGLLTADLVGALVLFGFYPNALSLAWGELRRLAGL